MRRSHGRLAALGESTKIALLFFALVVASSGCGEVFEPDSCAPIDPVLADSSFVVVVEPPPGARVESPLVVRGCSRTFESNVVWTLRARDGAVVASGFTTGGGLSGAAPFSITAPFAVDTAQLGHLEVLEPDESDGEGFPGGRSVVPVVLIPSEHESVSNGPSYDCTSSPAGSIEELVCAHDDLSLLDRELASAYESASSKAIDEHPPMLKAEQRGWIKGRDDCWKSEETRACVRDAYVQRIAELQARYRLVEATGPVRFVCEENPVDEVVATFFATDPPTLIAERGDSVSLMYRARSASGTRYEGANESFFEDHGEATITWGHGAPAMRCAKAG